MPFAKGVLDGREDLAGAAQLLHALCFDRVELDATEPCYEARWSWVGPDPRVRGRYTESRGLWIIDLDLNLNVNPTLDIDVGEPLAVRRVRKSSAISG